MSEFITVAQLGEIPAGEGRSYQVRGKMVAVFFVDDEYTAIDDTCPHMGASLASGHVEENAVYCPWHAWRFDIKDGTWLDNPQSEVCTPSYEVRIVGNNIQVALPIPPAEQQTDQT